MLYVLNVLFNNKIYINYESFFYFKTYKVQNNKKKIYKYNCSIVLNSNAALFIKKNKQTFK